MISLYRVCNPRFAFVRIYLNLSNYLLWPFDYTWMLVIFPWLNHTRLLDWHGFKNCDEHGFNLTLSYSYISCWFLGIFTLTCSTLTWRFLLVLLKNCRATFHDFDFSVNFCLLPVELVLYHCKIYWVVIWVCKLYHSDAWCYVALNSTYASCVPVHCCTWCCFRLRICTHLYLYHWSSRPITIALILLLWLVSLHPCRDFACI